VFFDGCLYTLSCGVCVQRSGAVAPNGGFLPDCVQKGRVFFNMAWNKYLTTCVSIQKERDFIHVKRGCERFHNGGVTYFTDTCGGIL